MRSNGWRTETPLWLVNATKTEAYKCNTPDTSQVRRYPSAALGRRAVGVPSPGAATSVALLPPASSPRPTAVSTMRQPSKTSGWTGVDVSGVGPQ